MGVIESFFGWIGMPFLVIYRRMESFGHFILFQVSLLPLYFKSPYRIKEFFYQMEMIGI